jgi:ferredoxin-NADP reductase
MVRFDNTGLLLGYLLLVIVGVHALWVIASSFHRLYWQNRQYQLSTNRLNLLIQAAQTRVKEAEQAGFAWRGYRKFAVAKKELECDGVYSFYLEPHDRKPLPAFRPGQHLTFRLQLPGVQDDVIRCYSLSNSASNPTAACTTYRVTIKKAPRPPGVLGSASTFFCDELKEGDIVDVEAPGGDFYLDLESPKPVVLIAGGVGVTPMVSMLNALLERGSRLETWFFYVVRNSDDHIFKEYLEGVVGEHPHVQYRVCYTKPKPEDKLNRDYQHQGRLSVALMKELLPSSNYEFFMCGPEPMMDDIRKGLEEWGVPKKFIRWEGFGPPKLQPASTPAVPLTVTFSRSGKAIQWTPKSGNLLEFALSNDVRIRPGCRAGSCGSCVVAIKSGDVNCLRGEPRGDGSCFTCICEPKSDLVLDA